ncbi:MAG: TetR/AcrR family transcriptional regulator [Silicimonas sp.]|nr:TetR/AcrR family transcriptional regulator [Silicimonas sp.]
MSERNKIILEAAMSMFARYGVNKTTMADIATEAGVARQTVYNAYQNKDDLLRAVVRAKSLESEAAVLAAWEGSREFEDKLDAFFELGPLSWYDSIQQAPDTAELIEGVHRIACGEMDEAAERWRGYFETEIARHFDGAALDIPALADFIHSTAGNAKIGAASRAELEARLACLKASLLALLAPAAR